MVNCNNIFINSKVFLKNAVKRFMCAAPEKHFIKLFSYVNKNKEVSDIYVRYGQKWSEIKTDNETLNSIFGSIDDGDGIIQPEELNKLNQAFNYIDTLDKKTKNNGIIEQKELKKFEKNLKKGKIDINNLPETQPKINTNWSEGLDRNITTIQLSRTSGESYLPKIVEELKAIGEEQGFSVEEINSGEEPWVEDSSIRRADGKQYVSYYDNAQTFKVEPKSIAIEGRSVKGGQGRVLQKNASFFRDIDNKEVYFGTSYLEGGNVLNTCLADGTPAAIVGESSIAYSMMVMNLENNEENIELAKKQIAKDLGLEPENVTFIPQYDFHIDMLYHPLHNGEIAVPDYEESIQFLDNQKEVVELELECLNSQAEFETFEKPSIKFRAKKRDLETKIKNIDDLIKKLCDLNESSKERREIAENKLTENGYKIVKIPAFSDVNNFMNGVGGTSSKTGETFYITNKPEMPELEGFIRQKFQAAGIDKVYFVSTTKALENLGGIDCLTQEK